jgi:hypothetical protein
MYGLYPHLRPDVSAKDNGGMFDRFSARGRCVVFVSRVCAGNRGAEFIELRDLLEALVREDRGELADGMALNAEERNLTWQVETVTGFFSATLASRILKALAAPVAGPPVPQGIDMPLAKDARAALERAFEVADEMRHEQVEPLHLLAAILDSPDTPEARLLILHGVTRAKVAEALGADDGSESG